MQYQPGRNDPCPCGSGKKYKHCHQLADENVAPATPPSSTVRDSDGAASAAVDWLTDRHRKGFKVAVETLFDDLWPDDAPGGINSLGVDVQQALQINLVEWLIAEGEMQVKGAQCRINAVLTGPDGPRLSAGQRRWLAQQGERPLRLYTVTEVRPGDGLTLCDAIDADAPAVVVQERTASRQARPGLLIGARVMALDDHLELSGAIYPFSMLAQPGVLAAVRAVEASGFHPDNVRTLHSQAIARAWLRQFVMPPELPKMIDASSGEPILLVTDHYRVLDPAALATSLAARADVAGDVRAGWRRELAGDDGAFRSLAAINPGKQPDRIEVFYRTQRHADEGRVWFDTLAGAAVRHLTREITDPQGALRATSPGTPAGKVPPSLPPGPLADAIEQALRRSYARWADEPMPALAGNTPRQAIGSAAGLERVKGLLRSYESGEADMAARDSRRAVSFQFLWDDLGIAR
jgi:hypothetical protein